MQEVRRWRTNFTFDWRPFDGYSNTFIADGDSLTHGVPNMVSWPNFLTSFPQGWLNLNIAVSGSTTTDVLARAPANVDALFKTAGKNIVVIWAGTNDGPLGGLTPAQSWSNLSAYGDLVRGTGFKVIVVPMISRNGWDSYKNSLNALIYADWPNHFDAIADVAANANLGADGAYANSTYFLADGIHTTTLANQTIEQPIIQAQINAFE